MAVVVVVVQSNKDSKIPKLSPLLRLYWRERERGHQGPGVKERKKASFKHHISRRESGDESR